MAYETTSESTEALLVTGGVGTGKTQRLVERAAALLAENAAAGNVLVLCATPQAARLFSERLTARVGAKRAAGATVATARALALDVLADVLPHREIAVCRELTKLHEEVVRGPLPAVRDTFAARVEQGGGVKGEIVLVIDGPSEAEGAAATEDSQASARERAAELKAAGARKKDIARAIAEEFGIARNAAYDISLEA